MGRKVNLAVVAHFRKDQEEKRRKKKKEKRGQLTVQSVGMSVVSQFTAAPPIYIPTGIRLLNEPEMSIVEKVSVA